jgi:hypothetical protein
MITVWFIFITIIALKYAFLGDVFQSNRSMKDQDTILYNLQVIYLTEVSAIPVVWRDRPTQQSTN